MSGVRVKCEPTLNMPVIIVARVPTVAAAASYGMSRLESWYLHRESFRLDSWRYHD
jgi:hypothetical protein